MPVNNIKTIRKKRGMKQAEVASLLNVSQGTYSQWENGKARVTDEALVQLASIFDVSTDYLLGYSTNDRSIKKASVGADANGGNLEQLSFTERILLTCFRSLPPQEQEEFLNEAIRAGQSNSEAER